MTRALRTLIGRLRPGRAALAGAACWAVLAIFAASVAFGSGEERTTNSDDLLIRTDSRWAGGGSGGYLPIRIRVTNHGRPRDLTFDFDPVGDTKGVKVRRLIGVEQNATVNFTLSVPIVESSTGMLHIYEGGHPLTPHNRSISVPSAANLSPCPPGLLVIAPSIVDCARFVAAANHTISAAATGGIPMHGYGMSGVDASTVAEVVPPTTLPESWIDYSGLDLVAISRDELEHLEHQARAALLKWVQSGGTLLIYDVGKEAAALTRIDRLIEAPEATGGKSAWQSAVASDRPTGEIKEEEEESTPGMPGGVRFGRTKSSKTGSTTAKPADTPWKGGKDAFHRRNLMLGVVYAFLENPFPGSINDWTWFLKSVGEGRWSWTTRHGMSPHIGTKDFFTFMNPGIQGVPTIAFLVLITLFSILIGPVNYVFLARKKMLWLLLFTVPVVAMTTSLLLVGYSVAVHGFAIRSRMRSLTVLDQRNQTAVTMARLALFAGVTPSGGMRFSPETAVYPVFPTTNEPSGSTVDWTQTQDLVSGWLPARTRTQFFTVRNAENRSRVDFKSSANGGAEFSNGLPWELEMIVLADDTGHLRVGRSVAAGATVQLAEPSAQDLTEFDDLLRNNAPALPAGFVEPTLSPFTGGRRWMVYAMGRHQTTSFESNLMERSIAQWKAGLPQKKGLAPRSYLAVIRENPGVETGVPSTSDQMSLHLLNGFF